jgi:hypothetical protein
MKKLTGITGWVILIIFLLSYVTLFFVADSAAARLQIRDLFYTFSGLVIIISLVVASLVVRGKDRQMWLRLMLAAVFWAAGDFVSKIIEFNGQATAERTLTYPDIFYFAAYVCLAAAVCSLAAVVRRPEKQESWVRYYPVVLVLGFPLITLGMVRFVPGGLADPAYVSASLLAIITMSVYAALDILIIGSVLFLFFSQEYTHRKTSYELVMLGLLTFVLADVSYLLFQPARLYNVVNMPSLIVITVWMLGYGLISLAATHRLTESAEETA